MLRFFLLTQIVLSFLFICCPKMEAMNWEVGIEIKNSFGDYLKRYITVYKYDYGTKNLILHGSAWSVDYNLQDGVNFAIDIYGNDFSAGSVPPLTTTSHFYIRIADKLAKFSHNGIGAWGDVRLDWDGIEFSELSNNSGYTVTFLDYSEATITLKNDFGSDYANPGVKGIIKINSEQLNNVGYSGTIVTRPTFTFPHTIYGQDNQFIYGYYRKWRTWDNGVGTISQPIINSSGDLNHTATYARKCNITIKNDFSGSAGSGGTIKFQGGTHGSPYIPSEFYDDIYNYYIQAYNQTINGISYTFSYWDFNSTNIGSQNPKTDFQSNINGTLKAKFTGKPVNTYKNLSFSHSVGQPIVSDWDEHPDPGVTKYQIWRVVKHNGVVGPEVLLTTVNRGTTTYTDNDYALTYSYTHDLVMYDVRAYYLPENVYADAEYISVFAQAMPKLSLVNEGVLPLENSLYENFPNPFNPNTKIKFGIMEDSYVSLKIYDMLGAEVKSLLDEYLPGGIYIFNFDAEGLPSGIYIYSLKTKSYSSSKKMILTK